MDRMVISDSIVPEEDFKKAFYFIRKNILKIFLNPYFSFKRKAATAILLINKEIYKNMIIKSNKR